MDFKSLGNALFAHHQDEIKLTAREDAFRIGSTLINNPSKLKPFIPNKIIDRDDLTDKQVSGIFKAFQAKCILELAEDPIPEELKCIKLGIDMATGDTYVFDNMGLTTNNIAGLFKRFPRKAVEILQQNAFEFVCQYNPLKGPTWVADIVHPGHTIPDVLYYNSYFIPPWQRAIDPVINEDYVTEYFKPFLEHLFPTLDSRNYVKWWIYKLMYSRCQDLLILIGGRGSGKTTLQDILATLVGMENFTPASKDMLTSKFNSEFGKRRLITLDDMSVTGAVYRGLKRNMNRNISVEDKGINAGLVINPASLIVSNNDFTDVYCKADERRFSFPIPTEVKLKDFWEGDKLTKFNRLIEEDNDFHVTFPLWIEREVKTLGLEYDYNTPFKTVNFWTCVSVSKETGWQDILTLLENGQESVNTSDAFQGRNGKKVSDRQIQRWIKEEAEEREMRGKKPYIILKKQVEDGNINYLNLLISKEEPVLNPEMEM